MPPSRPASGRWRSSTCAVLAQGEEGEPTRSRPLGAFAAAPAATLRCRAHAAAQSRCSGHIEARRPLAACRCWRRDPSSPARNRRRAAPASAWRRGASISDLAAGSGCRHGEQPRDHALDVAVDRRRARAEGDGGDRRRRVGADARQLAQLGLRLRKACRRVARRRPCAHLCRLRARL